MRRTFPRSYPPTTPGEAAMRSSLDCTISLSLTISPPQGPSQLFGPRTRSARRSPPSHGRTASPNVGGAVPCDTPPRTAAAVRPSGAPATASPSRVRWRGTSWPDLLDRPALPVAPHHLDSEGVEPGADLRLDLRIVSIEALHFVQLTLTPGEHHKEIRCVPRIRGQEQGQRLEVVLGDLPSTLPRFEQEAVVALRGKQRQPPAASRPADGRRISARTSAPQSGAAPHGAPFPMARVLRPSRQRLAPWRAPPRSPPAAAYPTSSTATARSRPVAPRTRSMLCCESSSASLHRARRSP